MAGSLKTLLILGVNAHVAEMADIVGRINARQPTWRLLGFVRPEGRDAPPAISGLSVLERAAIAQYPDAALVPSCNWPHLGELDRSRCVSLVDPSAFVASSAALGVGCVLYPGCFVGASAKLGDFAFCLAGAVINHDNLIGEKVIFASGATLAGHVRVGDGSYLGQSSSCRQKLSIGEGSLIGMGAVVLEDVAPNSVMVGNPARLLRARN